MKHISRFVIFLLAAAMPPVLVFGSPLSGRDTLSFLAAKQSGKLLLSIRGAYNPNKPKPLISPNMGECIDLRMKNNSDSVLYIRMSAGTILISQDSSVQDMIVTKAIVYTLQPKQKIRKSLFALCGELHRNAPDIYVNYEVGQMADPPMVRLAQVIEATGAQNKAGQYAVWALSDQATIKDLGEDLQVLAQSQALLDMAHINFDIFGKSTNSAPTIKQKGTVRREEKVAKQVAGPTESQLGENNLTEQPDQPSLTTVPTDNEAMTSPKQSLEPSKIQPPTSEESTGAFYLLCFGLTVVSAYWLMRKKLGPNEQHNHHRKV